MKQKVISRDSRASYLISSKETRKSWGKKAAGKKKKKKGKGK